MTGYLNIKKNLIHKSAIINWKKLEIGTGNIIGPYVTIGMNPQHPTEKNFGKIKIGNKNIIREFSSIQLPTKLRKITRIKDDCYIMRFSNIDHDCFLENNVILSSGTILGGNVYIMKNAQLGINSSVHQNQVIGSYSMIGMGSIVTKKILVLPGYTFVGIPAKKKKLNNISLKRNKISKKKLATEVLRFTKILKKWSI